MKGVLVVAMAGLAAWLPGSLEAAPAKSSRPSTLLTTSSHILKFAGDGGWIAWTARDPHCALHLRLMSLRTGKQVAVRGRGDPYSCGTYGRLALAGSHAVWTSFAGTGNTELDVAVATASASSPVARRVRFMAMIRPEYGIEPFSPPVAGRRTMLAYYRHQDGIGGPVTHTVDRLSGSRPVSTFRFENPVALAVDGGRIAVVRRNLVRGNACGCHFDPTWSPDGSKLAYISGQF